MNKNVILPPAKLGVLGGGQLGMLFVLSAKSMGYKVVVLDPDINSPAGKFADEHLCMDFSDVNIIHKMKNCSAITIEFENIPDDLVNNLSKYTKVLPKHDSIKITKNRILEKNWINKINLNTTKYHIINSLKDISKDCEKFIPGILKTTTLGYDGKGQQVVNNLNDLYLAFNNLGQVSCILEKFLKIDKEISVIICRLNSDNYYIYPVIQNIHKNGILDYSLIPANISSGLEKNVKQIALTIANSLDYIGVLTVEMFIVDDFLYVNELAPRPHNSGHFSIDACGFSQFDQQVRILCGFNPANTNLLNNCCMSNLLGDIWSNNNPNWEYLFKNDNVKLHLYGKKVAKIGRKMGHFTVLGENVNDCFNQALKIRKKLE